MRKLVLTVAVSLLGALSTWVVSAGALDPAARCAAQKIGLAGKYGACRLKAEARVIKKGGTLDFTQCDGKFSRKWQKAEAKGGGLCPSQADETTIQGKVGGHTDMIVACLSGVCPGVCGDGIVGAGEECDFGDLNGEDCVSQGFAGGTLECGAGCLFDTSGCTGGSPARFVDNGDGTVTDTQTGLMWEKKVTGSGCLHCVDDVYDWDDEVFGWLAQVNGRSADGSTQTGLGGHSDWRIATGAELQTIVDCSFAPCVDTTFGPTASFFYWSSSRVADLPDMAPHFTWGVSFADGSVSNDFENFDYFHVRAVRTVS